MTTSVPIAAVSQDAGASASFGYFMGIFGAIVVILVILYFAGRFLERRFSKQKKVKIQSLDEE